LSVLSGEKPVTDAIAEAEISRQMYYQLEERALKAMLRALTPFGEQEQSVAEAWAARIAELEAKVAKLQREKRRAERLLFLTRKTMPRGPLKKLGRPRKPFSSLPLTPNGKDGSTTPKRKQTQSILPPSMPKTNGGEEP
jgi:hypothetical protein